MTIHQRLTPEILAIALKVHVFAYRIYKSPEAFRLLDPAISPQNGDYPTECLLPQVLYSLWRQHPCSQHDPQDLSKVSDKMLLGLRITIPQPVHICLIECKQLHGECPDPVRGSIALPHPLHNHAIESLSHWSDLRCGDCLAHLV